MLARLVASLSLLACHKPAPPAPVPPPASARAESSYVGAEACADCHSKEHRRWEKDWHARAAAKPTAETVVGKYNNAHYKGASTEAWMSHGKAGYSMRTVSREGKPQDYPVDWLIGGKRMQDSVTVFPDGRWQVLPAYFHVTGKGEWVDYNASKQGAVGRDHPFFWTNFRRTANHECLDCHTTGLKVAFDGERWETSFADAGVSCEACHGPGSRHADSGNKSEIAMPNEAVCAHCHGPREPLYPFLDGSHAFTPGASYSAFYQPSGLVDGDSRSGEYFVDGRPSSSSFEWQALQQSKCHMLGKATCTTCHGSAHGGLPNELKSASCDGCHKSVSAGHDKHKAASCTDCHMAKTVSGVLDHFADHSIDIPVLENTALHGIPNACETCHAGKAGLAEAVQSWWPGSKRKLRRMRLADAFDEKGAQKSGPALVGVLRDASEAPILRGFAAELIGQRFKRDASRILLPFITEKDALLRSKVVLGLVAANARDSANALATLVDDPSLFVRQAAVCTLVAWQDARGVQAAERLIKAEPKLVRPHFALAQHYARLGELAAARAQMRETLTLMPYLASALVFDAELALQAGDVASAQRELEAALRFDPQNRSAQQRLSAGVAH